MSKITVKLKIVHLNIEINMSLDIKGSGNQIINALSKHPKLKLTKTDSDGVKPPDYYLVLERTGKSIDKQTLADANVKKGEILLLYQRKYY